MRIGVLCGGWSAEREVSLRTGEAVYRALLTAGYRAVKIEVDRHIFFRLQREALDLIFIALHGPYGEDGTIQGMLDLLGIPYTGSGVLASAICMDKIATKRILCAEQIATAPYLAFTAEEIKKENKDELIKTVENKLGWPVVVKAANQGSTIGISFVDRPQQLLTGIDEALRYSNAVLIEKMINGTELTVPILGNEEPEVLPLIEIVSATGYYDYHAKYTPGQSEHIIPPRIPSAWQEKVRLEALKAYRAAGCADFARVDIMVDAEGQPYVLEINTIPGMTETSLFPDAARAAGIEFPDLISRIVQLAAKRYNLTRQG